MCFQITPFIILIRFTGMLVCHTIHLVDLVIAHRHENCNISKPKQIEIMINTLEPDLKCELPVLCVRFRIIQRDPNPAVAFI